MKSRVAIITASLMVLGAVAGSAVACPYKDKVTASTPSAPSTNQTTIDEG